MSRSDRFIHLRRHGVALGGVGAASALGAVAAFAFHIATARLLGADDFGLLAAFTAIINVAGIGSSALQNSVAVQMASAQPEPSTRPRWFGIPVDALVVGTVGGVIVGILSPLLAQALGASAAIVVAAAVSMPLSFMFAAFLGRIQGAGRAGAAVGWSTASLVLRVAIGVPLLLWGAGVGGAVGAVVGALAIAVIGAALFARRTPAPTSTVFTRSGMTIIVITVALAWLTSSDVFFFRMLTPPELAGAYASVAVLVKASFILPSTLSIYLLPRFARNRAQADLTLVGVKVAILASAAAGVIVLVAFLAVGGLIVDVLFGAEYAAAKDLLVPVAAAYIPWIVLMGLIIQLTSTASRAAAAVLTAAAVVEAALFGLLLPSASAAMVGFGALGLALCVVLIAIVMHGLRRTRDRANFD